VRNLKRNETDFEYIPPDGETSDLNENGEHTGEFYQKHGTPVSMRGNISMPSGSISQQFFGTDTRYTHVLLLDNPNADISELGMVRWKGSLYAITAVRPSLNAMSVALRKKTDDHAEAEDDADELQNAESNQPGTQSEVDQPGNP
jgi:hypothetical protein